MYVREQLPRYQYESKSGDDLIMLFMNNVIYEHNEKVCEEDTYT